LTAETVRKTFGEGRIVNAQDALRRKMDDQVVPYPSVALAYASEFMKKRRRQADLDYTRTAITIAENSALVVRSLANAVASTLNSKRIETTATRRSGLQSGCNRQGPRKIFEN
jgi:hypothetical protein